MKIKLQNIIWPICEFEARVKKTKIHIELGKIVYTSTTITDGNVLLLSV